jgi:CheY-like chemotaxis protein/predicted regulator of Ras-like GTPase activity (Roadblock/LC7/MglB family)
MTKRVLIVDDEPNVAMMLSDTLEVLGDDYTFEIAHSGGEALEKINHENFNVVITDYNMPGMTGLDLAQAIRHVSPTTQVVLMTGYGTEELRNVASKLQVDGYLDKPFSIQQIRQVVQHAIGQTKKQAKDAKPSPTGLDDAAYKKLTDLRSNTGALCVLLITSNGYPVSVVGHTDKLDVTTASTLVAANFLAAAELANMLHTDASIFKSSYYEGESYSIYSYDVDRQYLLVVIFDAKSKPGVVWFYTKQIAAELKPLLEKSQQTTEFNWDSSNEGSIEDELDAGFDDLF